MKTKKLSKKLELNKKTVSNLSTFQMTGIKGGDFTEFSCPGWPCLTEITCTCQTDGCFTDNNRPCQ